MSSDDTAQAAYEAFCRARGKTAGEDAPAWGKLTEGAREGWRAAVHAVIRVLWIGGNDGEPGGSQAR